MADTNSSRKTPAPLVDMGANPLRRVIQVFEEARDFCEFFGGIKDEPDDDQCSHQDHRGMFGNCCSIHDCPVLRRDAR